MKYIYIFLFSLHNFYTSVYFANITFLSFGRQGFTENNGLRWTVT